MASKEEMFPREAVGERCQGNLWDIALQSITYCDLYGWRSPRSIRLHLLSTTSVLLPKPSFRSKVRSKKS